MIQQSPESPHLAGDTVCRADDQDRVIQNLQGALHLGGKIRMSRSVHQSPYPLDLCPAAGRPVDTTGFFIRFSGISDIFRRFRTQRKSRPRRKRSLLGKDRDTAVSLHGIRVQESVPMVHPSRTADGTGAVQKRLRECRLACVHMGQQANTYVFSHTVLFLL